jgi:hypothetical protein
MRSAFLILVFFGCLSSSYASSGVFGKYTEFMSVTDSSDTVQQKKVKPIRAKSPKRAALFGLIPGGGQIYNNKYWKLPLVYGLGYLIVYNYQFNNTRFQFYKDLLILKDQDASDEEIVSFVEGYKTIEGTNDISSSFFVSITQSRVQSLHDGYRSGVQSTYMYAFLWYGLTIMDAVVDAHFSTFDISDDLSLNIQPNIQFVDRPALGVSLAFNLK